MQTLENNRKTPFDQPLVLDTSKLPPGLRTVPAAELAANLRIVYLRIAAKARNEDVALDVTHEVLYRATTTHDWDAAKGSLEEHLLRLAKSAYSDLRYGSRAEKRACAGFCETLRSRAMSPEDIAIYVEEQAELDARDQAAAATVQAVAEAVACHPVAPRVLEVWAEHGPGIAPREVAKLLDLPVTDVHRAIELIRRHAGSHKVRAARRDAGTCIVRATKAKHDLRWRESRDPQAATTPVTLDEEGGAS